MIFLEFCNKKIAIVIITAQHKKSISISGNKKTGKSREGNFIILISWLGVNHMIEKLSYFLNEEEN